MKLFMLTVKTDKYKNYSEFLITANSIPDALEYMYEYTCTSTDGYEPVIPYYLRSSNINIKCIGAFEPSTDWNGNHIITYSVVSD